MSATNFYRVWWDLGSLDCRDPSLQKYLGMSLNEIISADPEYVEARACNLYGLPQIVSKNQLNYFLKKGKKGFQICQYRECN